MISCSKVICDLTCDGCKKAVTILPRKSNAGVIRLLGCRITEFTIINKSYQDKNNLGPTVGSLNNWPWHYKSALYLKE